MLDVILTALVSETDLMLSVKLRNVGEVPVVAAARAPYDLKDLGTLYASATEREGEVHLLLGDPVIPPHLNVFQPATAFYRELAPGAEIKENFKLALPLTESSPYEPFDPDTAKPTGTVPIERIRLSVGWAAVGKIRKRLPVEGKKGLWEVWAAGKEVVNIGIAAPSGVSLILRGDGFTRF